MSLLSVTIYCVYAILIIAKQDQYGPYDIECNPLQYGAVGDGVHDDTKGIQNAINECYVNNGSKGLVFLSSSKSFLSYQLNIHNVSNAVFIIQPNATLLMNDNINGWNEKKGSLLDLRNVNGFTLAGGGLLDGQGQAWWDAYNKNNNLTRPYVMWAHTPVGDSKNILIENITVINQPYHTFELYADYVEVAFVTVLAPGNTDETDAVDARGNYYYVHDCYFSEGDDNVAVMGNHSKTENCYFGTGHGASIGSLKVSYESTFLTNITFKNIIFNGTENGARIKAWAGQPYGNVTNVHYDNLQMYNVGNTILVTQYYNDGNTENSNLWFDDIYFHNITSIDAENAGYFKCQPSTPCYNFHLSDINVQCKQRECEWDCQNISGISGNVNPKSCVN